MARLCLSSNWPASSQIDTPGKPCCLVVFGREGLRATCADVRLLGALEVLEDGAHSPHSRPRHLGLATWQTCVCVVHSRSSRMELTCRIRDPGTWDQGQPAAATALEALEASAAKRTTQLELQARSSTIEPTPPNKTPRPRKAKRGCQSASSLASLAARRSRAISSAKWLARLGE